MKTIKDFVDRINLNAELFDNLDDNYVFWGRGNTSEFYKSCFADESLSPKFFIDKNPKYAHTKYINDIEVLPPTEISERLDNPIVFIVSANFKVRIEIKKQCQNLGLLAVNIDEYIFYKHSETIKTNYNELVDELSKKIYLNLIFSRIDDLEIAEQCVFDNQYFCLKQFLQRNNNEVYVDCGAYVGDTIEKYISKKDGVFKKIYAFEPDPANYNALAYRKKRILAEWGYSSDKIICEQMGLDDHSYTIKISSSESSLSAQMINQENGVPVSVTTIDDYFSNEKVSFIKADIESYELRMLKGAAKTIQRDHPLLAICIYHNATDLYKIQEFIKQIDNSYQFQIRHHYYDEAETVLYAY